MFKIYLLADEEGLCLYWVAAINETQAYQAMIDDATCADLEEVKGMFAIEEDADAVKCIDDQLADQLIECNAPYCETCEHSIPMREAALKMLSQGSVLPFVVESIND